MGRTEWDGAAIDRVAADCKGDEQTMRFRMQGVTLIELVVVIVIVGILASIAVPTYQQYVLRTHRVEAKTALMNLAAAQEKFYLQNNTYAGNDLIDDAPPVGLGIGSPTENGWYTLAIASANQSAFEATATATGSQLRDSKCRTFTIDSTGERSSKTSGNSTSTDECWKK